MISLHFTFYQQILHFIYSLFHVKQKRKSRENDHYPITIYVFLRLAKMI